MDLKDLLSNYRLLTSTEEGEVGISGSYILKIRPSGRLTHEYHVGLKLNTLNSPHFVRTLQLESHPTKPGYDILILSLAPGKSLAEVFRDVLEDIPSSDRLVEFKLFIQHLTLIITETALRSGFNHNDLHNGNIFIAPSELRSYTYSTIFGPITINSPYQITIIDYGFSYIDGVINEWAEMRPGPIVAGLVPSTRDDLGDLMLIAIRYLVMGRSLRISPEKAHQLNELAFKYGYFPFPRFPNENYPKVDWFFYGRENNPSWKIIFGKDVIINREEAKFWLSNQPTEISLEQLVNHTYTQLGSLYGISSENYEAINQRALSDPNIESFRDQIQKVFGSVVRTLKSRNVQNRPEAPPEVLRAILIT